jgi:hypothetical protein
LGGGVEDHHGAVDRGQSAVGILAEILVTRRVEQVEGEPFMLKAHHRRDLDAALVLDRHPIRAHPPPFTPRLDLASQLDRFAKQQQFLGRKGTPAENLVASVRNPWSQCLSLVLVRGQVDPETPGFNDPQCSLRRPCIEQDDEFSYAI